MGLLTGRARRSKLRGRPKYTTSIVEPKAFRVAEVA